MTSYGVSVRSMIYFILLTNGAYGAINVMMLRIQNGLDKRHSYFWKIGM